MSQDYISLLLLPQIAERETQGSLLSEFNVTVSCVVQDPLHPGQSVLLSRLIPVNPNMKLERMITLFTNQFKQKFDFSTEVKDSEGYSLIYVKYNNQYYRKCTISECGILNKSNLELVSFEENKKMTENEGFKFSYWSLPPLMLGLSFLSGGLIGQFDSYLRGLYFLIGSILFIPSILSLFIGLSEQFSSIIQTSFSGDKWIGECFCCNNDEDNSNNKSSEFTNLI